MSAHCENCRLSEHHAWMATKERDELSSVLKSAGPAYAALLYHAHKMQVERDKFREYWQMLVSGVSFFVFLITVVSWFQG